MTNLYTPGPQHGPSDAPTTPQATPPWLRPPTEPPSTPPSSRPPRRAGKAALAGLLAVGLTVGGGAVGATLADRDATPVTRTAVVSGGSSSATAGLTDVEQVANALLPVVVDITATSPQGQATGSGVIMRADGHILTNAHVVNGATSVSVTTSSGERLDAQVVGIDTGNDIAVLKVDGNGLQAATFARSSEVKVGQAVIAVGSPFGLSGSVTTGIVSALNRVVTAGDEAGGSSEQIAGAIQTDAAINPGNSGGALANAAGQVIGINTAIASGSGGSAGVGFAIPSDQALKVAEAIIAGKPAQTPFLGVQGSSRITSQQAQQYGLGSNSGAFVQSVVAGGPAAKAGLREGDLITKLGGTTVRGWDDLVSAGRSLTVGTATEITIIRDGHEQTLQITPAARPASG
jgi:putative serine protease PepD